MGVAALGLSGRGFDTSARPAFNLPLQSAGCISCGQCVALCPTGALTEKIAMHKQAPLTENTENTVCSFCSVGCKTCLTSKGSMLLRNLPEGNLVSDDPLRHILCAKGRFGFTEIEKVKRIMKPLVNGAETDLGRASAHINQKMQEIIALHGAEAAAISISDRLTNEEIALAKEYAHALGIGIYSFNRRRSGLASVTGKDASTCSFDEILGAEIILLLANDIMNSHPIAGIYIRRAVQNGAKLIIANNGTTGLADEWCDTKLVLDNNPESLKQVICDKNLSNSSEKTVIVFEQNAFSEEAGILLAKTACSRIIQLKPNANSQGLADLDIGYSDEISGQIENQTVKGLLVFAEDPGCVDLSRLDFLCVSDIYMTETAKNADVVLPCASFAESNGTYTNTVGKVQKLNPAILPVSGHSNFEIIQSLKNSVDASKPKPPQRPAGHLAAAKDDGKLFAEYKNTNALFNKIESLLQNRNPLD
jgi:formate dehydrogenase major subunit